jgi:nitric oxide reductase NorE protein
MTVTLPSVSPKLRRMPGAEGFWVFVGGDLAIFTLLFGSFMAARLHDPAGFEHARTALDLTRGGINTLLLLTSSWCVARALASARSARQDAALRWLGAGFLGGVGFAVSKVLEYAAEVGAGHTASSGDFFMYYFMLTGIHLVHVLVGCAVLSTFWIRWRDRLPERLTGFESAACYWHLVDLLWVFLFPLLYLVR